MTMEYPVSFPCEDDQLIGIIHKPDKPKRQGVIIVVAGGPQYRVGAHRQFVLLARKLAQNNITVLRFDLRGMGDSTGIYKGFQESEQDIKSAIDTLIAHEPEINEIILFGECESASGIIFYAFTDSRVKGTILINPWVRTEGGQAQTYLKHYYLERLFEKSFWEKVIKGHFNPITAFNSFVHIAISALKWKQASAKHNTEESNFKTLPLPIKTAVGLKKFSGKSLILTSGKDYIAREFDEVIANTSAWNGVLEQEQITKYNLLEADHTFSRDVWREQASDLCLRWLNSL